MAHWGEEKNQLLGDPVDSELTLVLKHLKSRYGHSVTVGADGGQTIVEFLE